MNISFCLSLYVTCTSNQYKFEYICLVSMEIRGGRGTGGSHPSYLATINDCKLSLNIQSVLKADRPVGKQEATRELEEGDSLQSVAQERCKL